MNPSPALTDQIMDAENPVAMLADTDSMASWSDTKKTEFADLFSKRTKVAGYLCEITVAKFAHMAKLRHFISDYHLTKLERSHGWDSSREYKYRYHAVIEKCDRDVDDVLHLADQRAKALLAELPPLKKAVRVIDPETAKKLDRLEHLQTKAEEHKEELEKLPRQIDMAEVDQAMTVAQFQVEVKTLFKHRNKLLGAINKIGEEAHTLEVAVSKALYKGLPGLSEAVVQVILTHIDRVKALGQMARRVTEQVKFGDSGAATDLLAQFEKDEVAVSEELKGKLNKAMAQLKASVKALPKTRKTKAVSAKATTRRGR